MASLITDVVEDYYIEPWPRLPRKTKKLIDNQGHRFGRRGSEPGMIGSKSICRRTHNNDKRRLAHYYDRKVK